MTSTTDLRGGLFDVTWLAVLFSLIHRLCNSHFWSCNFQFWIFDSFDFQKCSSRCARPQNESVIFLISQMLLIWWMCNPCVIRNPFALAHNPATHGQVSCRIKVSFRFAIGGLVCQFSNRFVIHSVLVKAYMVKARVRIKARGCSTMRIRL